MAHYPSEIVGITICEDDLDIIVSAAEARLVGGANLLIFTGGMSVEPDILAPTAIRTLGAGIVSHGVPSQPGNNLSGYLGDVTLLGVPGAAISLPTTMSDVLLPQVFTGNKLTKSDLINLGNGGLCQMCKACR